MFFSDTDLAAFLDTNFECSWEAVKPVPQVWIDFGNGKKLHRTLMGNVATWYCDAKGIAMDVLPGLATPGYYRHRAEVAIRLHSHVRSTKDPAAFLARYHATKMRLTSAASASELRKAAGIVGARPDISKSRVERPIKSTVRAALGRMLRVEARLLSRQEGATATAPEILRRDEDYNRHYRTPRVHALLLRCAGNGVDELTNAVFKIMHVDLGDPYLGLAPYVLGGKLGRHDG